MPKNSLPKLDHPQVLSSARICIIALLDPSSTSAGKPWRGISASVSTRLVSEFLQTSLQSLLDHTMFCKRPVQCRHATIQSNSSFLKQGLFSAHSCEGAKTMRILLQLPSQLFNSQALMIQLLAPAFQKRHRLWREVLQRRSTASLAWKARNIDLMLGPIDVQPSWRDLAGISLLSFL
eukprot:Skav224559  [mRNA]  locus=scaffold2085:108446:112335:- [translate_table: standard]